VLVRPSRPWTEAEQRARRERPRTGGSGWNRGTSRRPPKPEPKAD